MHVFCTWQWVAGLVFSRSQLCTHDTGTWSQSQMEMGVAGTPFILCVTLSHNFTCCIIYMTRGRKKNYLNVLASRQQLNQERVSPHHSRWHHNLHDMSGKHDLREMVWQRQSRNQIYLHENRVYQVRSPGLFPFPFYFFLFLSKKQHLGSIWSLLPLTRYSNK
jgi:hypothetical protein